MYLIHNYNNKHFDTIEECKKAIANDLNQHNISYEKVLDIEDNTLNCEILMFQYHTLYSEIYVILKEGVGKFRKLDLFNDARIKRIARDNYNLTQYNFKDEI